MATLWFHMTGNDIYTYFDTLEEAYFYGKKFSKNPSSYIKIVEHLYTHSTAFIHFEDTYQLVIFHGKNKPFVDQTFFPYGIKFCEKKSIDTIFN